TAPLPESARVRWFEDLSLADIPLVGGKNASLGELTQSAAQLGIHVPPGFALPTGAFRWFMQEAGLAREIEKIIASIRAGSLESLQEAGAGIRSAILGRPLPEALVQEISAAYLKLCQRVAAAADTKLRQEVPPRNATPRDSPPRDSPPQALIRVAVRSSATAEDLPEASFAGAQESFLNVIGPEAVVAACHQCFASLYTDRAINYRAELGFAEGSVLLSVGVQEMIDPSLGGSGVLFTLDTETGSRNVVLINAVRGLGEALVQGSVTPDEYLVFKQGLQSAPCPVLRRSSAAQPDNKTGAQPRESGTAGPSRRVPLQGAGPVPLVLEDETVLQLARWGCA
ncbi:MAG: phosphoenolpyruvate synthase, partial [Acidobacteriia bacterium]|nr:phosphoenolpyruvate synthase [Terriglobia bacterium]